MAKRRQWMNELKSKDSNVQGSKKKPKIVILSEEIYKEGELIETRTRTRTRNGGEVTSFSPSTPHHVRYSNEKLTPTFRKPDMYLQETKEILKQMSPHKKIDNKNAEYISHTPIVVNEQTDNVRYFEVNTYESNLSQSQLPFDYSSYMVTVTVDAIQDRSVDTIDENTDFCEARAVSILESTSPLTEAGNMQDCSKDYTLNFPPHSLCGLSFQDLPSPHQSQGVSILRTRSGDTSHLSYPNQRRAASVPRTLGDKNHLLDLHRWRSLSILRTTIVDTSTSLQIITTNSHKSGPICDSPLPGTSKSSYYSLQSTNETNTTHQDKIDKFKKSKESQRRRSKRKLDFNISYLDFVEEDYADTLLLNETFPSENSGSWDESESDVSSEDEKEIKTKKNKKKNDVNKKTTKSITGTNTEAISIEKSKTKKEIRTKNYKNRQKGQSYVDTKGNNVEGKKMKENPCYGKQCQNGCGDITEERRNALFLYFWGLESQQRRKDWIAQTTIKRSIKRSNIDIPTSSRRSVTYKYYINEGESRRQVCQQFLVATLDVSQRFILYTAETSSSEGLAKLDQRGKHIPYNKTPIEMIEYAKNFIYSLPLLPSHYCRKDSKRLYLPEDFKNITNLHNIYVNKCNEENQIPMSFKVFSAYFKNNFNITFHVPKKDKCPLCSSKSYDVRTEEEMDKMNRHVKDKEDSQKRFIFHQNLYEKDKSLICTSFDLQKVLNTPYGNNNMSLYYSRKVAVYNFTIYESGTRNGFCNVWTETDAHRGANEISTCLLNYIINNVDKRGNVRTLLLYSDSCFGQNKNKTVLSMLRYALSKCENLEVIQINYLVPGHTYMPVDSMHATIERAVRKTTVWAPSQWPTIIEMARRSPFPYQVTVLEGKTFMGFDNIVNKTFKKNKKLQISTISIVKFKKNSPNVMFVKRSMAAEANYVEIMLEDIGDTKPKENLYTSKLPISSQKYTDLKKLVAKKIIPNNYAKEFLDLRNSNKTVDSLIETDEED